MKKILSYIETGFNSEQCVPKLKCLVTTTRVEMPAPQSGQYSHKGWEAWLLLRFFFLLTELLGSTMPIVCHIPIVYHTPFVYLTSGVCLTLVVCHTCWLSHPCLSPQPRLFRPVEQVSLAVHSSIYKAIHLSIYHQLWFWISTWKCQNPNQSFARSLWMIARKSLKLTKMVNLMTDWIIYPTGSDPWLRIKPLMDL